MTHPSLVSDDDDNIFGSAEDYDDADLAPNVFVRPTKTSDGFGVNNHHYPYQSSHGTNNNARFNIPFGGSGSNAVGSVGNGINGNPLNGNNAIVTRTEVRSFDNEVSSATAPAIIAAFAGKYSTIQSMLFDYNSILFIINLLISVFLPLLAT